MPKYVVDGQVYDIGDADVKSFEQAYPNAMQKYVVGEKKYNVPLAKREKFLGEFKDAVAMGLEGGGSAAGKVEAAGLDDAAASKADASASAVADAGKAKPFVDMSADPYVFAQMGAPYHYGARNKAEYDKAVGKEQAEKAAKAARRAQWDAEDSEIAKTYAPARPSSADEVMANYRGMFDLTEDGKRLNASIDKRVKDLQDAYFQEYQGTPAYKDIVKAQEALGKRLKEGFWQKYGERYKADMEQAYGSMQGMTEAEVDRAIKKHGKELQDRYFKEYQGTEEYKAIAREQDALEKRLNDEFGAEYNGRLNDEMEGDYGKYNAALMERYGDRINAESKPFVTADYDKELIGRMGRTDDLIESNNRNLNTWYAVYGDAVSPSLINMMSMPDNANSYWMQEKSMLERNHAYLEHAKRLDKKSKNILDEARRKGNTNFLSGLARGFGQNITWRDFTFGLAELENSARLKSVMRKAEEDPSSLTKEETMLLDALTDNMAITAYYSDDLGKGYKAGQTTAVSIPFMLEMMANPIAGSGKAMAKSLLKYGLRKYGVSLAKKRALKMGTRILTDAAAATGMTLTTGAAGVAADANNRIVQDYDISKGEDGTYRVKRKGEVSDADAWTKAFLTRTLENQSEMFFNAFEGGGRVVADLFKPASSRVANTAAGKWAKEMIAAAGRTDIGQFVRGAIKNPTMRGLAERANFHGIGGEYLEEVYNNLVSIPLGETTWEEATDFDNNLETFIGLAPTSFVFGMFGAGGYMRDRYRINKQLSGMYDSADEQQRTMMTSIREAVLSGDRDGLKIQLGRILGSDLPAEVKRSLLDYTYKSQMAEAMDAADQVSADDMAQEAMAQVESVADLANGAVVTVDRIHADGSTEAGHVVGWMDGSPMWIPDSDPSAQPVALRADEYDSEQMTSVPLEEARTQAADDAYRQESERVDRETRYSPDITPYVSLVPGESFADADGNTYTVAMRGAGGTVVFDREDPSGGVTSVQLDEQAYMDLRQGGIDAEDAARAGSAPIIIGGGYSPADEEEAARAGVSAQAEEQDGGGSEQPADNEGNNGGENIPENGNIAPQNIGSADLTIPAMQRIPKDMQGNPLYEKTDSDTAWDAIVEQTDGDEVMAQTVADGMVADKEDALKKLEKAKSKGGATIAEKIAAEKKRKADIDAARQQVDIWRKIAGTADRRKMEVEAARRRAAEEAAALRKAEEERKRAEREEAERIEREALNGVPDMVDDTPQDARARGYRRVSGHKVDRQAPVQGLRGKEVSVRFSDDAIANGRVAVIEAEQLQPSHIQGVRNPVHFIDEAQPKERNDEASVLSARKIAGNIRPEEITSSVTAYTGAPTVNARGEVIQGNNRSDALRQMWEGHQEQAAKYKQYLMDHAEEFGLNADDIAGMQHPVLVTMLDVEDADAITLGQFVAQDTESGGVERIKPKNALRKMGADIRSFANLLLRSNDEETSFAGLVDKNGADVLEWMSRKGYITPTQYQSAFDSKGNITAEAKNDLRGVLYQSIFKGGGTRLEEMFNEMPAKAQKAILATAFRDYDSPNSERMIDEIQNSIRAYHALSQNAEFANAKTFKDARSAAELWKIQYQLDDATGESYLPAENFSNFALLLATMYKGEKQSVIQGTFNKLYDLVQGAQEASLFEHADNTPRTLVQAIYETLNIRYDGQRRSDVLAGDTATSQRGQQGGTGDAATGERIEDGYEQDDNSAGTQSDSGQLRNDEERKDTLSEVIEISSAERTEMETRIVDWLSEDNLSRAAGKTREEIFDEFGNELMPIAYIPTQFISFVSPTLKDQRIYCGKGYFIDHALRNHAGAGVQVSIDEVDVSKYLNIQTVLDNPDHIKETYVDGKRTVVFIKKIGRFFAELTQVEENGKVVLHKSFFNQKKEPYAKLNDIRQEDTSSEGGTSSISHTAETAPAISLQSRGDVMSNDDNSSVSGGKGSKKAQTDNGNGEKNVQSVRERVETDDADGQVGGVREQKGGGAEASSASAKERSLLDGLVSVMRKAGIEVIADAEEGQRVLDAENGGGVRMQATIGGLQKASDFIVSFLKGKTKRRSSKLEIPERANHLAERAIGHKIKSHTINANELAHSKKRHGINGTAITEKSIPLRDEDFALMPYIMSAPTRVVKGSMSLNGTESVRYEKELSNGIVVVVEREGYFGIEDMENITMWAEKKSATNVTVAQRASHSTSETIVISEADAAKIRKDAEDAIRNWEKLRKQKVYHGSGADFEAFDHSHMGEGEGAQAYGWGTYVTEVEGIGRTYAKANNNSLRRSKLESDIRRLKESLPFRTGDARREGEEELKRLEEELSKFEDWNSVLYTIEIPDDNGDNYLQFNKPVGNKRAKAVTEALYEHIVKNDEEELYADDVSIKELKKELASVTGGTSGGDLYGTISIYLGSDEAASKFLDGMGIIGVKYPSNFYKGGNAEGKSNYVIFNEANLKITDKVRFFRTADGQAYGFTVGGKIYIDPRIATAETPIHEYAHLWASAMREVNPEEWRNIVGLMKGTWVWDEVKRTYPELKTDDEIADEVLAHYSGRRGAERLRAEQEKIANGDGDVVEKAEAISALNRVKDALKRFWKGVADWLGVRFTSAEEVADKVLSDLLNGVDPNAGREGASSARRMQKGSLKHQSRNPEMKTAAYVAEMVALAKAGLKVNVLAEDESYVMDGYDNMVLTPYLYGKFHSDIKRMVDPEAIKNGQESPFVWLHTDRYDYLCQTDENYNVKVIERYGREGEPANTNRPFVGEKGRQVSSERNSQPHARKEGENGGGNSDAYRIAEDEGVSNNHALDWGNGARGGEVRIRPVESLPLKNPKGNKIYGWAFGGEIYLTPDGINSESPIHEYTHLWCIAMQRRNRAAWDEIVSLLKGSNAWKDVVKDKVYSNLDTEDRIASEVLSRLSGEHGAKILEREAGKEHEGNTDSARAQTLLDNVKKALEKFWRWVGTDLFQIRSFSSVEEVKDRVLYDLVNGTDLGDVTSDYIEFQRVTDPVLVAELESGDKILVYRGMQLIDGKLYPPMAAKMGGRMVDSVELGVWEQAVERPDLVDKNGKFKLDKANGKSVPAAYNPYIHTSTTPLNDQFAEAQSRPNLVTVEVEVPRSELSGSYKAYGAKDATGVHQWKAGVIQGQLSGTREVILSRYDKPVRIVPDGEVADVIVGMFGGRDIVMPSNVVTPSLRSELEKRGIRFVETDNRCRITEGEHKGELYSRTYGIKKAEGVRKPMLRRGDVPGSAMTAAERRRLGDAARWFASGIGLGEVEVYDRIEDVPGYEGMDDRRRRAKGWFDQATGRVAVVAGNHVDAADIQQTVLHEAVAHKGLRELLGDRFDGFLDGVLKNADEGVRAGITGLAKENGWDFRRATEEYLAGLAEDGRFAEAGAGWWKRVKRMFVKMLRAAGFGGRRISDGDLRYVLWRSLSHLKGDAGVLGMAEDVLMQYRLSVGNYGADVTRGAYVGGPLMAAGGAYSESVNRRFNEELERQMNGTLDKGHIYQLGVPSSILISTGIPGLPIQMSASRLEEKATRYGHDFSLDEIKDLVNALQHPLAVFEYGDKKKAQNIIVEIQKDGKNFVVGLSIRPTVNGRVLEINSIRNVFPKNNAEWLNWISQGKSIYLDKEKIQALIAQQRTILADVDYLDLDSVAKIVENFENPSVGGGILYRDGDVSDGTREAYDAAVNQGRKGTLRLTRYNFREAFQDELLSLKLLQDIVEKKYGVELRGFEDAYLAENRLASMNEKDRKRFLDMFYEPMMEEVDRLIGDGASQEEINRYLMAKSGLERNREFAVRDYFRDLEKEAREMDDETARQAALDKIRQDSDAYDSERDRIRQEVRNGTKSWLDAHDELMALAERTVGDALVRDYSGLSGMFGENDFERSAVDFVLSFESGHETDEVWKRIRATNDETLRKCMESGMIDGAARARIGGMFDYYVPLRGFDDKTVDDVYAYVGIEGDGGAGKVMAKAKGRTTVAKDPLAVMAVMGERAILQGNRNWVKQHLLNMALNRPTDVCRAERMWYVYDPVEQVWKESYPSIPDDATPEEADDVITQWEEDMRIASNTEITVKDKNGNDVKVKGATQRKEDLNVDYIVPPGSRFRSEHAVRVMRGGKEYVVFVHGNPRAAQAVNGLLKHGADGLMLVYHNLKRMYSSALTQYNVNFAGANIARDVQHSLFITLVNSGVKEAVRLAGYIPRVAPALARYIAGRPKAGSRVDAYVREFMENGGETGYAIAQSVDTWIADNASRTKRVGKGRRAARFAYDMTIGKMADWFSVANRMLEGNTRLAAYVASRDGGDSVERAVKKAKDITVNFNKKGSGHTPGGWGQLANFYRNWFMFANPIIQGTFQFYDSMKMHPWRFAGMASTFLTAGMLVPMLNQALVAAFGGDDDDYYNLNEYTRRSNLMLFTGDGYVKIPLPQTLRNLYALGDIVMGVFNGRTDADDALPEMWNELCGMLSLEQLKVGGGLKGFGHNLLGGSMFAPVSDVVFNEKFNGMPIYKENVFGGRRAEYLNVYGGTWSFLVDASRLLNDATNGEYLFARSPYVGQMLNPAVLQHLLTNYTGGIGQAVGDVSSLASDLIGGELSDNFSWRTVPVAKRFYQDMDEITVNSAYKRRFDGIASKLKDLDEEIKETKRRIKDGDRSLYDHLNRLERTEDYGRLRRMKRYQGKIRRAKSPEDVAKIRRMAVDEFEMEADGRRR